MKVAVVFPVSLCLPNPMYYSLPMLAGALRRGGHEPSLVDLNVRAADLLLDADRSRAYLDQARAMTDTWKRDGHAADADRMSAMLDVMEPKVAQGQASRDLLRDPVACYDQPRFKRAFWNVVDVLGFFYQKDPVISPHRERFGTDMKAHQQSDSWTPTAALYDEGLMDAVLAGNPAMVAISIAFPEQAAEAIRLARLVRARAPEVHVAVGGPLISGYTEKWFEDDWILDYADSVCLGDGETAIVELADAVESGRSLEGVTNLCWRDAAGVVHRNNPTPVLEDMDSLPLPDFDGADMGLYLTPKPIYPMMLSRGCYWGRCTFCSLGWRENFRQASDEKLRADAEHMVSRYGARYVQLQDSSVPPSGARRFARIVAEGDLGLYWVGGFKFEKVLMSRDYCDDLYAGGCRSLLMGLESSEQRTLDTMDKGYDIADAPQMMQNLRDAGISAELLWFIGFPGETRTESLATARYLHDRRHLFGLTAFVGDYLLHPDTLVFQRPDDFGVTVLGQDNDHCLYSTSSGMQPEEVQQLKSMLDGNNNRTLVCNAGHLPHLVENGMDLSGLERPMTIPEAVESFCRE